jgi:hypothetical protein
MVEVGRTYGWRVSEVKSVSQLDLLRECAREGREVSMTDEVYAFCSCILQQESNLGHVLGHVDGTSKPRAVN